MSRDIHDYLVGWTGSRLIDQSSLLKLTNILPGSVSQDSKQQILQPLSVLRPKFRVGIFETGSLNNCSCRYSGCCTIVKGYGESR
jgi:hypothetical protein